MATLLARNGFGFATPSANPSKVTLLIVIGKQIQPYRKQTLTRRFSINLAATGTPAFAKRGEPFVETSNKVLIRFVNYVV